VQERGTGPALTGSDRPGATEAAAPRRHGGLIAGVAAVTVLADQATKWWALRALDDGPIDLVWTLRLRLTFNTGTAFSLGAGRGGLVALLAIAVVAATVWFGRSIASRAGAVAMGLVLGGAVGNLADRILRADDGILSGAVVDFIDLQWWPVFNVADMAIVVGALLLLLTSLGDLGPEPTGGS
jgi:signal peptidase II